MNTGGLTTCSGALLGCDNRQGVVLIWDCYRALQLLPLRVGQWHLEDVPVPAASPSVTEPPRAVLLLSWMNRDSHSTAQPLPTHQPWFYLS